MSKKLLVALIFLGATYAYAQRAADIQARYGKSLQVYSVSEHIWMTPEYASDGQVCRMRFYPKRISGKTNYGAHDLPFKELSDVLNALAPVGTRGAKKESFGATATGGPAAWTTYGYENVTVTFTSFFPSRGFDGYVLKRGEYVFPSQNSESAKPKDPIPSNDDFVDSASTPTEIVTVRWHGRKCIDE